MALELTQPLSAMSIRYIQIFTGGKGGWCVGLTNYHLHLSSVLKSGSLNLLEPSEPVQACTGITLTLSHTQKVMEK